MTSNSHSASEPETKVTSSSESSLAAQPVAKIDKDGKKGFIARPISLFKSAANTLVGLGGAVGNKVAEGGKAIARTSFNIGGAIGRTASQTGQSVLKVASGLGGTAVNQSNRLIIKATEDTGQAVSYVGDSPLIRKLAQTLKLDWLIGMSDQVDVTKATEAVRKLQQEHPDESPSQIAHRIMVEKAIYAGGVGLASSLVPGEAIALLAVDVATTTALQTEMLYQIAAAYGLDLKDPARKGEAIAIFGLALGGSRAIKAGLVFVKNLPFAGAFIGASANATMLYALGYAACRFYEAKLDPGVSETSPETLQAIQHKSENYLEVALAQQSVMDQILAHMLLASYPEKSWEDILPNLQSINLHPNSLEAIAEHLKSPQPLGALLDQLNRDFAVLTLSRCYAIAQLDNNVSPKEAKVLEAISEKFEIDLEKLKKSIESEKSITS
jgi:uncharacterized protein (DUF697 family)